MSEELPFSDEFCHIVIKQTENWFKWHLNNVNFFIWRDWGYPIRCDKKRQRLIIGIQAKERIHAMCRDSFIKKYFVFTENIEILHTAAYSEFLLELNRRDPRILTDTSGDETISKSYNFCIKQVKRQISFALGFRRRGNLYDYHSCLFNAAYRIKDIQITPKNVYLPIFIYTGLVEIAYKKHFWYKCIKNCYKLMIYSKVTTKVYQRRIEDVLSTKKFAISWKKKRLVYNSQIVICGFSILKKKYDSKRNSILNIYMKKKCAFCKEICRKTNHCTKEFVKNKKCKRCQKVFYCCRNHQKIHWKSSHKFVCGV